MSDGGRELSTLGDKVALEIQAMHKRGRLGPGSLFGVDYRHQGAGAPFLFDVGSGLLHRSSCRSLKRRDRSLLYAVWTAEGNDFSLACRVCKPEPQRGKRMDNDRFSDMIYGFASLLEQFGSVLRERGKEYRKTHQGRQLANAAQQVLAQLDQTQRNMLDDLTSIIDSITRAVSSDNNGNNDGMVPKGNNRRSPRKKRDVLSDDRQTKGRKNV
jgi:hypothetical protein